MKLSSRSICLAALFLLASHSAATSAQTYRGVNLAGMEFNSGKIPGRYGWDYISPKESEFAYYAGKGMNVFRIPVLWERLQPALNGPLDPAELGRLQQIVEMGEKYHAHIIVDIHNYGRYRGKVIGSDDVTPASFADVWRRLAEVFKEEPAVMFGLMNEPQLSSADSWAQVQQQAIDAIRGTGARNDILVSGIGWDGAHNFPQLNGDALAALRDPAQNLVYEVHQYFDSNYSGTKPDCIAPPQAAQQLTGVTAWLRARRARGFLGEFGVGRSDICEQDLSLVVKYMQDNRDVWLGWTYWAGGPLWGDYMFTLDPTRDGQDRPQMDALRDVLK